MSKDKDVVRKGYDQITQPYHKWNVSKPGHRARYMAKLLEHINGGNRVLELGCGSGLPITKILVEHVLPGGGEVVANDFSAGQIAFAQTNCPQARYIEGDMAALQFEPSSFHAVVSFFAIFHLPRDEQKPMLQRIFVWLRPGGRLVCNLATSDQAEIRHNFLGADMFWSSLDVEKSKRLFTEVGFTLEEAEVRREEEVNSDDPDYGITFLWILAKKPLTS